MIDSSTHDWKKLSLLQAPHFILPPTHRLGEKRRSLVVEAPHQVFRHSLLPPQVMAGFHSPTKIPSSL